MKFDPSKIVWAKVQLQTVQGAAVGLVPAVMPFLTPQQKAFLTAAITILSGLTSFFAALANTQKPTATTVATTDPTKGATTS